MKDQYQIGTDNLIIQNAILLVLPFENILNLLFDYTIWLVGLLEAARVAFAHNQQQKYASWYHIRKWMC